MNRAARFIAALAAANMGACAVSIDARRLGPPPDTRPLAERLVAPGGYSLSEERLRIPGAGCVKAAFLRRDEGAPFVVVFSGGRRFRLERASRRAARLAELTGAHILLYDYPGRGGSGGAADEASLRALATGLIAAVRERGWLSNEPVLAYGFSFGGAMAAQMAASGEASAVVIEASADDADAIAENLLPPPIRPLLAVKVRRTDDYASALAKAGAPILLLAGDRDDVVPAGLAENFAEDLVAAGADLRFEIVADAAHGQALYSDEGGAAVRDFAAAFAFRTERSTLAAHSAGKTSPCAH